MRRTLPLATAMLLLWSAGSGTTAAHAQGMRQGMAMPAAEQDCASGPVALPDALAGWPRRSPLAAAADRSGLGAATLVPGQAVDGRLRPTGEVRYELRPEKPGGSVSFGGLYAFTVSEGGAYRIALGGPAWIDVVRRGKGVVSTAHGHGPACSGIRKMVDFTLSPGRYVLQISANGAAELPLMLVRLP